jgi:hypothetical protein
LRRRHHAPTLRFAYSRPVRRNPPTPSAFINIGDDMVLVDTPGLFGHEEKVGEESQVSQISKTEVELRKSG